MASQLLLGNGSVHMKPQDGVDALPPFRVWLADYRAFDNGRVPVQGVLDLR